MSSRSMTDVAYDLMKKKKKEIPFNKIWEDVSKVMGLNETQTMNKIAPFYSALMLDPRFTLLPDNKWDLRERHTYSETHIDTSSLVIDDEDEIIEDDDDDDSVVYHQGKEKNDDDEETENDDSEETNKSY